MTVHKEKRNEENYEETRTQTRAERESEKIAPEKETVGGDLKDAVSTIVNDDGRMDTGYSEADYDRDHPDKA